MRLGDAAAEILKRQGDGRPMHYRRITEQAIAEGLISPGGLTPEASMIATLTTEIKRATGRGEDPRFTAYGKGLYGLSRAKAASEVEEAVSRNNSDVRERLHEELRDMNPRAFEELIARLLEELGFVDVEVTNYSGDGGIDVRGTLAVGGVTNVQTAIQVKRWANNVSGRTVRELRGGLSPHERGLIITTSAFTRDAMAEAATLDRTPISLVDGGLLVNLLVEHGLGAVTKQLQFLRLDPDALLPVEASDVAEEGSDNETTPSETEPLQPRRHSPRPKSGKNLSLWPLPGGRGNFVHTMQEMLTFISEHEPTLDEFLDWMIKSYPKVNSRKSAQGYLDVPRLSRLAEFREDRLALTTDGATYLASGDPEDLYRALTANIAGLEESLRYIEQKPCTIGQLTKYLNETIGTTWETDAQATWRVQWLESFGKVKKDGDVFVAVAMAQSSGPSAELGHDGNS